MIPELSHIAMLSAFSTEYDIGNMPDVRDNLKLK
jgi:hypothetical protein